MTGQCVLFPGWLFHVVTTHRGCNPASASHPTLIRSSITRRLKAIEGTLFPRTLAKAATDFCRDSKGRWFSPVTSCLTNTSRTVKPDRDTHITAQGSSGPRCVASPDSVYPPPMWSRPRTPRHVRATYEAPAGDRDDAPSGRAWERPAMHRRPVASRPGHGLSWHTPRSRRGPPRSTPARNHGGASTIL